MLFAVITAGTISSTQPLGRWKKLFGRIAFVVRHKRIIHNVIIGCTTLLPLAAILFFLLSYFLCHAGGELGISYGMECTISKSLFEVLRWCFILCIPLLFVSLPIRIHELSENISLIVVPLINQLGALFSESHLLTISLALESAIQPYNSTGQVCGVPERHFQHVWLRIKCFDRAKRQQVTLKVTDNVTIIDEETEFELRRFTTTTVVSLSYTERGNENQETLEFTHPHSTSALNIRELIKVLSRRLK